MWRQTTKHECNRRIWDEELADFVPQQVLDFHVHLLPRQALPPGQTYSCAGHEITRYELSDLEHDLPEIYPGRQTAAVCFGFPDPTYDLALSNQYLAQVCDRRRFFPLRLLDPHEDPGAVRADVQLYRFLGFKPYPDYVGGEVGSVEIRQMLPDWAMEIAEEFGLLIMLHIPRPGRLADPVNQRQIVELCTRYPHARVVLAHIGRAYFFRNVVGQLDRLKELPNLWVDLAMLNHPEVIEYTLKTLSPGRVLYGTDIPIALAPGKSVEINHQYTYVTPVPWKLSISDDHRKLVFTSFLYEQLRAMKRACQRAGLTAPDIQRIFHGNGTALIAGVGSRR